MGARTFIRFPLSPASTPRYQSRAIRSFPKLIRSLCVFPAFLLSLEILQLLAQDVPKADDTSFDIEPPLLVKPWEQERGPVESSQENSNTPLDPGRLAKILEQAKKDANYDARLVRTGALSKVEAEQQALRVVRLESELANAQMLAAQAEVSAQKARFAAGQATQSGVDAAAAALTQATAAAQAAEATYRKAQLDAAVLNLRRQRQLLSLGSARKSDVARAEEKLAQLQQGNQARR
jgi:hypothetical protein